MCRYQINRGHVICDDDCGRNAMLLKDEPHVLCLGWPLAVHCTGIEVQEREGSIRKIEEDTTREEGDYSSFNNNNLK